MKDKTSIALNLASNMENFCAWQKPANNRSTNKDDNYADMTQFMLGTANDYKFTSRDFKALLKVLNGEIPLVVKVSRATDILNVLKFAESQQIDLVLWGAAEAHMVADEIAKADVPVVLDPLDNVPRTFDSLNSTYENAIRLDQAGVKMAFYYSQGAGSHNAYLATQSAGNSVAMGLDYATAMRSITSNLAEIFGLVGSDQSDSLKTIFPSKVSPTAAKDDVITTFLT